MVDFPAVGTNFEDNYEVGVEAKLQRPPGNIVADMQSLAPGDPCLREWDQNATGPYTAGCCTTQYTEALEREREY